MTSRRPARRSVLPTPRCFASPLGSSRIGCLVGVSPITAASVSARCCVRQPVDAFPGVAIIQSGIVLAFGLLLGWWVRALVKRLGKPDDPLSIDSESRRPKAPPFSSPAHGIGSGWGRRWLASAEGSVRRRWSSAPQAALALVVLGLITALPPAYALGSAPSAPATTSSWGWSPWRPARRPPGAITKRHAISLPLLRPTLQLNRRRLHRPRRFSAGQQLPPRAQLPHRRLHPLPRHRLRRPTLSSPHRHCRVWLH